MNCPNTDALQKLLRRELDSETARSLEKHLEACPPCVGVIKKLEDDASAAAKQEATVSYEGADETVGMTVGPYKLLQKLGEGGMGSVWMAEQREPVRRFVALKIIKTELHGSQIIARFEAERQALAMMDHPNIAKVLDAGYLAPGESPGAKYQGSRPYFVMELVKGISFTQYCDQEKLPIRERLELFIQVCNAVQHAHQKGVVHRDLKPSNVLIALYDGKPVPKVIDFGVAKAMHHKLTDKTMFTEVGRIVGTLEYMAPEQAELNNLDIDTRADIYSLGVMLYELLTGSPPFSSKQLRGAAFDEVLRIIREVEPSKPSTKLSSSEQMPTIAANRKLEPRSLTKMVRGDLDWIVMKCLEKERKRRYETASDLAQELQRYLADEPVQAGPPSVGYRARKFLRRNKGGVIAAALVLFVLIAGIVGTGIGFVTAEQARSDEAAQRKAAFDALSERAKAEADARIAAQNEARALDLAGKAETARADEIRRKARLVEAHLAMERGMSACERDQVQEGLLWLAHGLEATPEDDKELQQSFRRLLAAWSREICTVQQVIPLEGEPLAISPDNKMIAEAWIRQNQEGFIRLRELDSGKPVHEPLRMQSELFPASTAFSPDSKLLAVLCHTSDKERTIRLWDVSTGKPVGKPMSLTLEKNTDYVNGPEFSPDSKILTARCINETTIRMWEVPSGNPIGEPIQAYSGEFSPDSKELATVGGVAQNGRVDFWDTKSGKKLGERGKPDIAVSLLAHSPDGKFIAYGGTNAGLKRLEVHFFDRKTGKGVRMLRFPDSELPLHRIIFAPDAATYLVQTQRGIQRYHVPRQLPDQEIDPPEEIGRTIVEESVNDDNKGTRRDHCVFSPSSRLLLTASAPGATRIWDPKGVGPIAATTNVGDVSFPLPTFDRSGKSFVSVHLDSEFKPYVTRRQIAKDPMGLRLDLPPGELCSSFTFHPDGNSVALVSVNPSETKPHRAIRFYDRRTGKDLGTPIILPTNGEMLIMPSPFFYSADGKILLVGCENESAVRLFNAATRKPISNAIPCYRQLIAVRPGSNHIVVAGDEGATLYDMATGKRVGPRMKYPATRGHTELTSMHFSHDGKFVFACIVTELENTDRSDFIVWNADTGQEVGPKSEHGPNGFVVSVSPDGKQFMTEQPSGQAAMNLYVWDAATHQRIGSGFPHNPTFLPTVSRDWTTLMTCTRNRGTRFWDLNTGKPRGRSPSFAPMSLSPNGAFAVVQGAEQLRLWDVASGQPLGRGYRPHFNDPGNRVAVFSSDNRALLASVDVPWLMEIPQPLEGDPARVRLWIEVITGRELDDGGEVAELNAKTWQERHDRLQKLGGSPVLD